MGLHLLPVAVGSLILYACALSIYRLYFHPLSKYPGPKLAAITNWYALFYTWRGDLHFQHLSWHQKHGDIVRAGPNSLWFNSHSAMTDIYGTRANVRKADTWIALSPSRRSPNILNSIDKGVHGFKRRTLAPVFSDQGMKLLEDRILSKVDTFIALLGSGPERGTGNQEPVSESKSAWTAPRDMASACDWLAFDIISEISYSKSFDMMRSPELRWIPRSFTKLSHRSMMCLVQPKIHQWKIDRLFLASMYKEMLSAGSWVFNRAKDRAERGNNVAQRDIFSSLMNAKDPKRGLLYSLKDLWIESMLLLAAGADTTSATMTVLFFYLLHNPHSLSQATAEVRTTFAHEDEIRTGQKLASCSYLQACINETMRLFPAVLNVSPRQVQAGGMTVENEFIPEGTTVGTSLYTLQRNERYFARADEFWPERWIADERTGVQAEAVERARRVLCPFGIGTRSCVGWKMAWMELNVVLARTLFVYEAALAKGGTCCARREREGEERCAFRLMGWAVGSVEGPVAQFRRREL